MHIRFYLFSLIFFAVLPVSGQENKPSVFLSAGIPAVTRQWIGNDYARTVQILSSGVTPLPYFSDKQGSELLSRITALENFSFHRNQSIPIEARIGDWRNLYQSINSLIKMYYLKSPNGREQHVELARLMAFSLHASVEAFRLVDEFLPTVPKDEKFATRMGGLRQMKSGLTTVFVGSELTLTEDNGFSAEDRSIVLDAMALTLPKLKSAFTPDYKFELRKKLQEDKSKFKNATDTAKIDSMTQELEH